MKETVGIDLAEIVRAGTYDAKVNRNISISGDGVQAVAESLKEKEDKAPQPKESDI